MQIPSTSLRHPSSLEEGAENRCLEREYHVYFNSIRQPSVKVRVQELCESRGGRPGLSVLMSLTVSVDVKQH